MSPGDHPGARIVLRGPAGALAAAAGKTDSPFADPAVAVVIAEPSAAGTNSTVLAELRALADRHDLAFLIIDDIDIADQLSADGVEIDWSPEAYAKAREIIGKDRTVGCRVGLDRHAAMAAAEAGADYVSLGGEIVDDHHFEQLIEMTAWWAEIFEIACLSTGARSPDEATRLAATGADFVSAPAELWGVAPATVLDALAT